MKKSMVSRISAEGRTMISITCKHIHRIKKNLEIINMYRPMKLDTKIKYW